MLQAGILTDTLSVLYETRQCVMNIMTQSRKIHLTFLTWCACDVGLSILWMCHESLTSTLSWSVLSSIALVQCLQFVHPQQVPVCLNYLQLWTGLIISNLQASTTCLTVPLPCLQYTIYTLHGNGACKGV